MLGQVLNRDQRFKRFIAKMAVGLEYVEVVNFPLLINRMASWGAMSDDRLDIQSRKAFDEIFFTISLC